jgi:plastocyanin
MAKMITNAKPFTFLPSRHTAWIAVLCFSLLSLAAFPAASSGAMGSYLLRGPVAQAGQIQWAATGGGLLVTGSGRELSIAMEDAPSQPVARLKLGLPASGAALFGRYAYVVLEGAGIEAFDLSSPSSAIDLGLVPLGVAPNLIAQAGDQIVLFDAEGMKVARVGSTSAMFMANGHQMGLMDPTKFTILGSQLLNGPFTAATASGLSVLAATEDGRLIEIDISDPANPVLLATMTLPERAIGLAASGDLLFASTASGRFLAMDMTAPEGSSPLAEIALRATSIVPEGRLLYAAAGESGLVTLSVGRAQSQTVNVNVGSIFFQPSSVSINVGDTVKWTWVSGSHTSTSGTCSGGNCTPDGVWNSGVKSSGTFTHTFSSAGDSHYFCSIHLSSMTGVVHVAGAAALSATASATPTSGQAPLLVHFTGSASGGTAPYTYAWDFGDSASSTDQNPDHSYASDGTFTAALTVHDSAGGSAPASPITITVSTTPPTPPTVSSMAKLGSPFRITVTGGNFQSGIKVFINGNAWSGVTFNSATSLTITGGKSLKKAVPKNTSTSFRFVNTDGGETTFTFKWP